jgi:hypothetical protein
VPDNAEMHQVAFLKITHYIPLYSKPPHFQELGTRTSSVGSSKDSRVSSTVYHLQTNNELNTNRTSSVSSSKGSSFKTATW